MEVVTGGNLLEKITKMRQFTEQTAAKIIKQLLLALNLMHSKNIMHRDLKPENILVEENADSTDESIRIKLTDFGFATKYDPNKKINLSLGSPLYMAPELCQEKAYGPNVDAWAVGVITYILMTGKPPFYDRTNRGKQGIYDDIIKNEADFSLTQFQSCSAEALDFIKKALVKKAINRVEISQLLNHPWIKNMATEEVDNSMQLDMSNNLAIFAKTTSFQSGICSILANMLSHANDLTDLNKMFVQWDTSQDGYLSYDELN